MNSFRFAKSVSQVAKLQVRSKHTVPDLPYDYGALEPFISAEIMRLHHSKHHQAYVTGLNTAEEKLHEAVAKNDLKTQISLQGMLNFNGGGHVNHSIFWTNLAPQKEGGGELPKGALLAQIQKDFGSVDLLKQKIAAESAAVQGSGWGWLGWNSAGKRLEVATTPNQNALLSLTPLLGIDVWEHAYYLQYKNVRPDYLKAIWNVVNWRNVGERFQAAQN